MKKCTHEFFRGDLGDGKPEQIPIVIVLEVFPDPQCLVWRIVEILVKK
jgi:hypothetical protein